MKFQHLLALFLLLFISTFYPQTRTMLDPKVEAKIDSLLTIMSIDEKIGQLNQLAYGWGWGPSQAATVPDDYKRLIREGKVGSLLNAVGAKLTYELQKIAMTESRTRIPLLFGFDVIHGVKTTFPIPLAESCSWDLSLIEKSAAMQAKEAAACGIHWTFTPMVDIARDPRWGRIAEGNGEDPFLGSLITTARVKGLQGDDLSGDHILACAKHFAAYGAAEGGRDYNTVDISERTLRETYLPPFKAAVDAGAQTFMCSFNEIAGIPSSANKHLLTEILRDEWKFSGFVVSDWNSIGEMVNHGIAKDNKQAGLKAIRAGLDMDMETRAYSTYLKELLNEGSVPVSLIDESVRRILRIKFRMNLFADPYRFCDETKEAAEVANASQRAAALELAQSSLVLLKNTNNILPISKTTKSIALIGPLANNRKDPLGSWEQFGDTNSVVTVLEGLQKKLPDAKITYVQGCPINETGKTDFSAALHIANVSDLVVLVLGEEGHYSGEAASRSSIELPSAQSQLFREILKSGKPMVVVLMNGRPLAIPDLQQNAGAILESWFPGITAGDAIASALVGDFNPSGKLTVSFPRATGQIPVYYNHKNTGRPASETNHYSSKYLDISEKPLYPFGFGLSYSTFTYSNLTIDKKQIGLSESATIKVDVKNSGNYPASEVVQLYINRNPASVTRPVRELKNFQKITLQPNETKSVVFILTPENISFYNDKMQFGNEPGQVTIFVGTNSVETINGTVIISEKK